MQHGQVGRQLRRAGRSRCAAARFEVVEVVELAARLVTAIEFYGHGLRRRMARKCSSPGAWQRVESGGIDP